MSRKVCWTTGEIEIKGVSDASIVKQFMRGSQRESTWILAKCCFYARLETRLKECTDCASRGVEKPRGEVKANTGWKAAKLAQPGADLSI